MLLIIVVTVEHNFLKNFTDGENPRSSDKSFYFSASFFNSKIDWKKCCCCCCCCCCLAVIFWGYEKKCQNEGDDYDECHNVNHFKCLFFHGFFDQKLRKPLFLPFLPQPQVSHRSSILLCFVEAAYVRVRGGKGRKPGTHSTDTHQLVITGIDATNDWVSICKTR